MDVHDRQCDQCGIDLALAAVLAEYEWSSLAQMHSGVPISPEILVPRLGDYLKEKGVLHPEGLQKALMYQKEKTEAGQPCLIGQALMELGLVDRATLDEAITEQILQLQRALQHANRGLERRVEERTADLRRALDKLSELNQLKSNFISNISHELRTPLTHIKGYVDMLADQSLGPLTPQQSDALKVLQRAETRLERLIEDLIQFSLAAKGELSIRLNATHIDRLIQTALSQVESKALEKKVCLHLSIPNKVPPVLADEVKINWVLMQLLDNAIKFTPKDGRVTVEVNIDNGLVNVAVIDTGIGIPPEQLSEIFEPFHQLDGSVTRHHSGTGLGLSMVQRILDAHGSSINVESSVGQGSCFEFILPTTTYRHVRRNS